MFQYLGKKEEKTEKCNEPGKEATYDCVEISGNVLIERRDLGKLFRNKLILIWQRTVELKIIPSFKT